MQLGKCKLNNTRFPTKFISLCTREILQDAAENLHKSAYIDDVMDAIYAIAFETDRALCVSRKCINVNDLTTKTFRDSFNYSIDYAQQALSKKSLFPSAFIDQKRTIAFDKNGNLWSKNRRTLYQIVSCKVGMQVHTIVGYLSTDGPYNFDKAAVVKNWGSSKLPTSQCSTKREFCQKDKGKEFAYVPGNKIILGMFSINTKGDLMDCNAYHNLTASVQVRTCIRTFCDAYCLLLFQPRLLIGLT